MKYQKLVAIALVTTMLAGCNPPPQGAGGQTGGISKQDIGTVLGSTMGGGNGRIATTAAGAILGGLAGSALGSSLDKADAVFANRTTQTALETAPAGQALPWRNPQSGNSGVVIPQAPYQTSDGSYCREYTQKIAVGGKTQSGYGKACRQRDGSWQIIQ